MGDLSSPVSAAESTIPEPSSLALLLVGTIGIYLRRATR
ncbi:PEP-CTERM sorting domain-containing protein [Bythopirellula goksoeyrii]